MKKTLKKENSITLIISLICFVIIGIIATYTYSFFAVNKTNSAIIAGVAESLGLTASVTQTAPSSSSNLIPQLDEYITKAIIGRQGSCVDDNLNTVCHTYKILVKNGNVATKVNGILNLTANQSPNLKWAIYNVVENEPTLVGNIKTLEDTNLITNEEFTAGEEKEYHIVVWISETGMAQTDRGTYSGIINFTTVNNVAGNNGNTLDDSGANYPELTDGLIPVMYDETRNIWVKADILDNTSPYSWYNYTEKRWANAVLVNNSQEYYFVNRTETNENILTQASATYSLTYASGDADSSYPLRMEFTTGTSAGILSFDYSINLSEFNGGSIMSISLNGTNTFYGIPEDNCFYDPDTGTYRTCDLDGTYSSTLAANTSYTLVINYLGMSADILDDMTINNVSLPDNLEKTLTVYNYPVFEAWDGGYELTSWEGNNSSTTLYSQYSLDSNGDFVLSEDDRMYVHKIGSSFIGKYMCSDGSTKCSTLYEIKEVNNNTITSVFLLNAELTTVTRESLKDASAGTEIPEDAVLAYYVWIPRYKYMVWNKDKIIGIDEYNAENNGINIVFESGTNTTGEVICTYDFSKSATDTVRNEECSGTNGESYYTHPAFTFGEDELTGFWMGKYEVSSPVQECMDEYSGYDCSGGNSTALTPRILSNVFNWAGNSVNNYETVIKNMQVTNNIYGISTDLAVADSHMITNMEWGAVSYLANSNYGICADNKCTRISGNSNFYYGEANITGTGGSTTGNIYGVYDMVAGAEEYVKTDISSSDLGKYITTYAPRISSTIEQASYNITRLGDAIGEIISIDLKKNAEEEGWEYWLNSTDGWDGQPNGWYSSYVNAPSKNIKRGGSHGSMGYGYIFDVNSAAGDTEIWGTRATLAVFP